MLPSGSAVLYHTLDAQMFLLHKFASHRTHISDGNHIQDVGLTHTKGDNCPRPHPFLRSETLFRGSILIIFRTADPVNILYLLLNSKLPIPLSGELMAATNSHGHLLLYRLVFPCRNICLRYFVFRILKMAIKSLLALSRVV